MNNKNIKIIDEFNEKIKNIINYFIDYIDKINFNKISINLISEINIKYSNKILTLSKLAIITKEDYKTLIINPFDKNLLEIIKKCILNYNLDLNVHIYDKSYIKIIYFNITEDKKKKIIKMMKDNSEKTKISIRNLKREFNNKFKYLKKEKIISEDELNKYNRYLLENIDKYTKYINNIIKNKEDLLLKV